MKARREYVEKIVLEAGQLIKQRITEDMKIERKNGQRSD